MRCTWPSGAYAAKHDCKVSLYISDGLRLTSVVAISRVCGSGRWCLVPEDYDVPTILVGLDRGESAAAGASGH